MEIAERCQSVVDDWLKRSGLVDRSPAIADSLGAATLFLDLTSQMMSIPASVVSAQMSLWQDYFSLWQSTTSRLLGGERPPAEGLPPPPEPAWRDADIFAVVQQSLLLTSRWMQAVGDRPGGLASAPGFDIEGCVRQFLSSLSAAGFALNNPELLRATIESGGENLVSGLTNLLSELQLDGVRVGPAGRDSFVVGLTVARTPGKVIFRNALMEVIQYSAQTERVLRVPLLFIPAWAGRYYLLDLRQSNSLVRWAVDRGHTVFMVSWIEPAIGSPGAGFEEYLADGALTALDVVQKATGEAGVNVAGHSLGGTLLAAAVAHCAAEEPEAVRSASFLASVLDFSQPGELGALMDEAALRMLADADHDLSPDAGELALACALPRQSDLLWSFVVNNLLLGNDPFPFDLLHWNEDPPRLPLDAHAFYLHAMYRQNRLADPGGIGVAGRGIDLQGVDVPSYFLATREDHIAPWRAAYRSMRLLGGERRFTLAASGHLAGLINPPAAGRYCYWTNPRTPDNPDEWRASARTVEGSWWRDWDAWLRKRSADELVPARVPGGRRFEPLCDAPGRYVTGGV